MNVSRAVWLLILLTAFSLACSLITNLGEQIGGVRATVQSVATDVDQGLSLYGTAQALATQVGNSGLLETALAAATEVGESGLLQTAQAVATEQGPGLLATARAFATEDGDQLIATAQALATEQGAGLVETAQAAMTQVAGSLGEAPADIPLVEGERNAFFASAELVTYTTDKPYAEVVEFYRLQMPANGWTLERGDPQGTPDTTVLVYLKPERRATVSLYHNAAISQTIVMVTLSAP